MHRLPECSGAYSTDCYIDGMQLYDSMRRKLRAFQPLNPHRTTVYGCGPTVYDFAHIGNFRAFVVYDLLHRHLRSSGRRVDFVVNFTDVDDKTIDGAAETGCSLHQHTARFIDAFREDCGRLGLLPFSQQPRATGYIEAMVRAVERLVAMGCAYHAGDGSVYYAVSSFGDYGKLSGKGGGDEARRSRIEGDEHAKRDVRDFALWKAVQPRDREVGAVWDSPWGPGRPGWHLECSVMVHALLGDTVDIHLGGEDLMFPHHENEIAQSEAATGVPFARFWLHVKHLKVDGRKMSKSLGNFYTVRDLVERGYDPAAIRWVLLSAHYRNELNFTFEGLDEATDRVQRLLDFRRRVSEFRSTPGLEVGFTARARERRAAFREAMDLDLNVPRAVAALWTMVKEVNAALDGSRGGIGEADREGVLEALAEMDAVLGVLDLAAEAREVGDEAEDRIRRTVEARNRARAARDFATADRLRAELEAEGVRLEDTPSGTRWKRVHAVSG